MLIRCDIANIYYEYDYIYICKRDEKSFVTQKGVQKIFFENKKGIDPSAHSVYFTQIKSSHYQIVISVC